MQNLKRLLSMLSVFFISGCASLGITVANIPTHFDGIVVKHDIAYGSQKDQKLDLYFPAQAGTTKHDVLVFLYGGRWESGEKSYYSFVGSAFAKAGYIVAIPDYRKYPEVRFPVFAQDAAKSIAWVADHIAEHGGNKDKIFVMGHSSGAHLGALVAANPAYLQAEGKDRSIIKSFVGLAGPYDFTPDEKDLKDMFGPPEKYPEMQVTTFIDGQQPPMLLLYGDKDKSVGRFNLDNLKKAIDDKGGCVQTHIYPDVNHVWIVGALSWLGKSKAPVLQDAIDFFKTGCSQK